MKKYVSDIVESIFLPSAALLERRCDHRHHLSSDCSPDDAVSLCMAWLRRAQDNSTSNDGGVSRSYSLISGWASSYPETTGYIIPTFIDYALTYQNPGDLERARRMLDWLVTIQFNSGAFQGGKVDSVPVRPVTFNTGQILIGLAAGQKQFGCYSSPMRKAADWLVNTQEADGCWRKFPSPFSGLGLKAYETHVAWGLFEAARLEPDRGYAEAAVANNRWALTLQSENGWFDYCALEGDLPISHTLGYVLRGLIEAYRFTFDRDFLDASMRTADALLSCQRADGFVPGEFNEDWSGTGGWACLTGCVQLASCWFLLYQITGDKRYRIAGSKSNEFVRKTIRDEGSPDVIGAIKGSLPVDAAYGRYEYLNWAAKFFVDSHMHEQSLDRQVIN